MGGFRRHNSPTGVGPKVDFAGVTGISRPVTSEEHWSLYYFEAHAVQCDACKDPLKVSKEGRQLCDEGHRLAIDVAGFLIFRHKEIYSRVREGQKEVRVEVPHDYSQTLSLLEAINRATRAGDKFPMKPRSHDRKYLIESRLPVESSKRDRKNDDRSPSPRHHYDTITREPKSPKPRHRERESTYDLVADSKRGSLYGLDMGELEKAERRDQQLRYNVEVREPTSKTSRRHHGIYS